MKLIPNRGRTPIGLDVGGRCLRAVQLSRCGSGWRVAAAAAVRRLQPGTDIDGDELARFRQVLRHQCLSGSEVVLAVPAAKLLTGVLELPPRTSGAPIGEIARAELGRMHDRPGSSFEMCCWDLPAPARAKKGTPVMAAACGHDDADALLDVFEAVGLSVVAMEAEVCSLGRALAPLLAEAAGITAVLQLGWSSALVVLLYGDVVVYQRTLTEAGMGRLHAALTESLGLDAEVAEYAIEGVGLASDQEPSGDWQVRTDVRSKVSSHFRRVVEDLQASLSYAVHQYPDAAVDNLLLTGEAAAVPALTEFMSSLVSAKVRVVRLSDLAQCPPKLPIGPDAADFTKAVGLARFLAE